MVRGCTLSACVLISGGVLQFLNNVYNVIGNSGDYTTYVIRQTCSSCDRVSGSASNLESLINVGSWVGHVCGVPQLRIVNGGTKRRAKI